MTVWQLPPEPPAAVQAVWDAHGRRHDRDPGDPGRWWSTGADPGDRRWNSWPALLFHHGPVSDLPPGAPPRPSDVLPRHPEVVVRIPRETNRGKPVLPLYQAVRVAAELRTFDHYADADELDRIRLRFSHETTLAEVLEACRRYVTIQEI